MPDKFEVPNIILVNCDDYGYGDTGCYGSKVHKTPALDRMAREGMLLTDFYMAAPVCSPSRAALMTGCYPQRVGLETGPQICVLQPGDPVGLHPEEITVADILRSAGYNTKIIGKWHLGDQPEFLPTKHGFNDWYGLPYSNDMGRKANRPDFPPLPLMRGEDVIQQQPDQTSLTERYTEESVRFIRENRDNRFFLYLAHTYVHTPLYVPRQFLDRSDNGAYGAAVEHIDWTMAVILHELEQQGLSDDTLVIFTSDNGADEHQRGSNAPLRGFKGSTWEGGMREPCIMRWPGAIRPGSVCSEMTTAMDLLPTLAALAGAEPPADRILDGKNILPILLDEKGSGSEYEAFFYYRENELRAVRSDAWKLHLVNGELYNLEEDIGESNDVSRSNPGVVEALKEMAQSCRADLGDDLSGEKGANRRPCGYVDAPKPLTTYDPRHPYMIAMYD